MGASYLESAEGLVYCSGLLDAPTLEVKPTFIDLMHCMTVADFTYYLFPTQLMALFTPSL